MNTTNQSFDDWLARTDMAKGKRQILKATVKLFADNGYQGTSTAMIAKEAGVSEATIFKHFKSKKVLLDAILQPIIEQLLPDVSEHFVNQVQHHATTLDDLIAYVVRDRYYFLLNNYQIAIILLNQVLVDEAFSETLKQTLMSEIIPGLQQVQSLLDKSDNVDPKIEVSDIIKLIVGQFIANFLGTYKLNISQDDPESVIKKITLMTQRAIRLSD